MQKAILFVLILVLSVAVVVPAMAQDGQCSPDTLSNTLNDLLTSYSVQIENADTTNEAIDILDTMSEDIDNLYDRCANIDSLNEESLQGTGTGTLDDPFSFNFPGDSKSGFSIQVTQLIRPADSIVRNANMFNERPSQGQTYVIVELDILCHANSNRCETNPFNFELVGSRGIVYEWSFVVIDDELNVNIFPGATESGRLVYLIDSTDTDLVLLYSGLFFRGPVAYSVEPDLSNGIQITAQSNVNIRTLPSTNASVAGNLSANTPIIAFGRNSNSTWLQIESGWVFADLVSIDGNISILPVTAD